MAERPCMRRLQRSFASLRIQGVRKKQRVQPIRMKSPFVPWLCSQLKKDNYRQVSKRAGPGNRNSEWKGIRNSGIRVKSRQGLLSFDKGFLVLFRGHVNRVLKTLRMTWKQLKCPLTEEQMNKMCQTRTMEGHRALERKET